MAEGVVESVVDHLGGDAQPRGGVAVDHQCSLQPPVLLIAAHVRQVRQRLELPKQTRGPGIEFPQVISPKRELIRSITQPSTNANVLDGLQIQARARYGGKFGAQPRDDLAGADLPLGQGFQRHEHPPRVAAPADTAC